MSTLIIDSNNLCYRALIIRGSREAAGLTETKEYEKEIILSVVHGFLVQILKLAFRYNTNQFIFVWDTKPYHRTKLFPEYKSKRASVGRAKHERRTTMPHMQKWGPPPHLGEATFRLIREKVLPKIGFRNIFCKEGFEADDIIASLVQTYSKNISCESLVVISSDKDLYQLLDYCKIFCHKKKEMTRDIFMQTYPFPPQVWPIFRAITGDPSDAIPGIHLVGPTFAIKFLTKNLGKTSKAYQHITCPEGKEIVRRNLKLMSLPWPGVGTFSLKRDELSFPAFTDLVNRMAFDHVLKPANLKKWRIFFEGG